MAQRIATSQNIGYKPIFPELSGNDSGKQTKKYNINITNILLQVSEHKAISSWSQTMISFNLLLLNVKIVKCGLTCLLNSIVVLIIVTVLLAFKF